MTDREVIVHYHDNVVAMNCLMNCIDWNQRHGLPVLDMPDRVQELKKELLRFEDVLAGIPDIRTRNILRCRYALNWTELNTADYMELHRETVRYIAKAALDRLS